MFHDNQEVLFPDAAKCNSVIVFDNVSCEKQNNMRDFFVIGRHK